MAAQDRHDSAEYPTEASLVAAAVSGDRVALERLLLASYDHLAARIASKLPARLQSTQAVEDILQLAFFQVFRDINDFEPRADATFGDWLARIADNRLLDCIKSRDCARRGGDRQHIGGGASDDSRLGPLLDWIAADQPSPASVVARREALQALQVAIASLPTDQRQAIELRLLEGQSLEETAAALGRTPDAVRGLVHRGKEALQAAMGRASLWFSVKQ